MHLVWVVIVLGLYHGLILHHRLILLLLIIVHVDGLTLHLLLIMDLLRICTILIVSLVLEVAHAGVLHVLGLDVEDVHDAKDGEDGVQDCRVHTKPIDASSRAN